MAGAPPKAVQSAPATQAPLVGRSPDGISFGMNPQMPRIQPDPVQQNQAQPNIFQKASGALTGSMMGTAQGMNYTPQQVQAGTMANVNMNQYMNPYTQQVIDATMQDLESQRQMQQRQMGAQAQQAGAFGGSRHGVSESLTNLGFGQQMANTAANLRQQGYTQAQNIAQQDLARQMQARLANQGAGLQGAQLRLGAAGQMGNLAQDAFGMGQTVQQGLQQQGALQQSQQQAIIDAIRNQYQQYQQQPERSLGYLATALGAAPVPQTQTTQKQLGLFDYLGAGIGLAGAMGFSDISLKEDIKLIKKTNGGHNWYSWKWNDKAEKLGLSGLSEGVIAQEIQKVIPQAIRNISGYLAVDYGMVS